MPKKPPVGSGLTVPEPTGFAGEPSQAKKQAILSNVNALVQGTIRATLIAATSPCKCQTCQAVRKLSPHVNKILELGEQVTQVRAV